MFKLHFSTDNAAFDGNDLENECAWIFSAICLRIRHGSKSGAVRDSNGNTIGSWELLREQES